MAVRPPVTALLAAVVAGLVGACAQQEAPPGGPQDRRPPVVVRTTPSSLEEVTDLGTDIRFDFDERISERSSSGTMETAITISPRSGDTRVKHGRSSLTLEVEGGLRPGLVYRVTLQPVVSDMFGNRLADPFELVFTTGAELVPTTVAGEVWQRVDGGPLTDALVWAESDDSLVHQAVTDRAGIFALRYLPAGRFTLTAFEDVNRNGQLDSTEVQGVTSLEVAAGDTVLVDVSVLEPDSTAAQVVDADVVDSVTLAVEFDDFLDPAVSTEGMEVSVERMAGPAPDVVGIFQEHEYALWVEMVADSFARLDSLDAEEAAREAAAAAPDEVADSAVVGDSATVDPAAVDSAVVDDSTPVDSVSVDTLAADSLPSGPAVADTVAAPADTVRLGAPTGRTGADRRAEAAAQEARPPGRVPPTSLEPLEGTRPGPTRDGRRILPGRRIVLQLSEPVVENEEYVVSVSGVVNIHGLPGGGGADTMLVEPPPDTTTVDSIGALSDSLAQPDTGGVARGGGR